MDENAPLNQQINRLSGTSRTGSEAGDSIAEQGDQAEEALGRRGERGEQYAQEAVRQRRIAQRMRMLSESDSSKGQVRGPRNAKFQKAEEKKTKLDKADIGLLLGVSILFDLMAGTISLLDFVAPPAGEFINGITTFPLATFTLYMMYKRKGIEFKSKKALTRFWGSLLLKFIPIISIFPEYTLNVILITLATKAEEKVKSLI